MGALKSFETKMSNWCGLWYNRSNNSYISQIISLKSLKEYKGSVRVIVRKNKFFNRGENNRPNYSFCIVEKDAPQTVDLEVEENDYMIINRSDYEDVIEKINGCIRSVPGELRDVSGCYWMVDEMLGAIKRYIIDLAE